MGSLLELCRQCGLKMPADYVMWLPFGAVLTATGERKVMALAEQVPTLAERLRDASGQQIGAVPADKGDLPRRLRASGERLLRKGLRG
jgi:hypothetical protein